MILLIVVLNRKMKASSIFTPCLVLMSSGFVIAQEENARDEGADQGRIYTTREERREAGLKHEITDWLTVSGLFELEYLSQRFSLFDTSSHTHDDNFPKTLQLSLEISPWSWVKGETIYEYDDESNRHTLDEAIAAFEGGDFELELGKLFVPFGVYFSHKLRGEGTAGFSRQGNRRPPISEL
jgi:hypothetical protein